MQHLTKDDLLEIYAQLRLAADDRLLEAKRSETLARQIAQLTGNEQSDLGRYDREQAAKLAALAEQVRDEWRALA